MVTNTQENGKKISNMVEVRKHGRMELSMKETTRMARSMEMESLAFMMVALLKVNSLGTRWKVLELINGMMVGVIVEIGTKAPCMVKVSFHGKMDGSFAGLTSETRRKALVHLSGPMDAPTKVCGPMGSSMVKESTRTLMVKYAMVFGQIVSESNG